MGTSAVVILGAAARISQETALLRVLWEKGELEQVEFMSGVSSGALNTFTIGTILKGGWTWEAYLDILFKLKTRDVYLPKTSLPWNTNPLHRLLLQVLDDMNLKFVGDLQTPSAISGWPLSNLREVDHFFSLDGYPQPSDPNLKLIEVLMGATAIPLLFPPHEIGDNGQYMDAGVYADFVPFNSVRRWMNEENTEPDKIFIVAPNFVPKEEDLSDLLSQLEPSAKSGGLWEEFVKWYQNYSVVMLCMYLRKIMKANTAELNRKTYVYYPEISYYPFLLFNLQEDQYKETYEWAQKNEPVLIGEFLKMYEK